MIFGILGAVFGVAVGFSEYLLLREMSYRITGVKNGGILLLFLLKFAIYAAAALTIILCFKQHIIYCGVGYAAGIMLTALVMFIKDSKKQ